MSERGSSRPEPKGDAARLLLASARARFSAAASDFLLPQQARLTEWQRLTAAALLLDLVGGIEGTLRATLAAAFAEHDALHAALSSPRVAIALPILDRAEALRGGLPTLDALLQASVQEALAPYFFPEA